MRVWAAGAVLWTFLVAATPSPSPSARLIDAARTNDVGWKRLAWLTDRIGPRLSGSAGAEAAVAWTAATLRADGLDVRTEPVMVPHWVRGVEEAKITAPVRQSIAVTALGGSVPTPDAGIEGEVIAVDSLEELGSLPDEAVRGRIVLFDKAMPSVGFEGYAQVSPLRTRGATAAEKKGAIASLVRSLGTLAARLPHTGTLSTSDAPHIPAAAVSAEDADLLRRLLKNGPVRLSLRLGCLTLPDAISANVVAELRGRERPDEVVVIGAHLDSWDLGTGAIDDGAGVVMVMEALRLMKSLGIVPRRTVRGVLYMNEENGGRGGKAYASAHAAEALRHVAAIEADSGAARPVGLRVQGGPGALAASEMLVAALKPLGPMALDEGEGGSDIEPLAALGVPGVSLRLEQSHYFQWHHSAADTLDKVDPAELKDAIAAMAVLAYTLADAKDALPRVAPSPKP